MIIEDEKLEKLNKTNRMVFKTYMKASDYQRVQMRQILKEQTENLAYLLFLMDETEK